MQRGPHSKYETVGLYKTCPSPWSPDECAWSGIQNVCLVRSMDTQSQSKFGGEPRCEGWSASAAKSAPPGNVGDSERRGASCLWRAQHAWSGRRRVGKPWGRRAERATGRWDRGTEKNRGQHGAVRTFLPTSADKLVYQSAAGGQGARQAQELGRNGAGSSCDEREGTAVDDHSPQPAQTGRQTTDCTPETARLGAGGLDHLSLLFLLFLTCQRQRKALAPPVNLLCFASSI